VGVAALVAIVAVHSAPLAMAAAAPSRAALEARFAAALAAGRIQAASAIADSLVRSRGPRRDPLAAARDLDTLGLRFYAAGTPEALQAGRRQFTRALTLRERALGPTHPDVALTLRSIATLHYREGRWTEALPHAERALAIQVDALGERDPEVAATRRLVGLLLFPLGRYPEAASQFERSLAAYESQGNGYAAQVADGCNNMGEVSRVLDRYDAAVAYFERGLAIARDRMPGSALMASLQNNLAGLYKDMGRYDEAEPLMLESLAEVERASTPDPASVATANLNLAEIYRLQGRMAEAEPRYAKALAGARAVLPAESPDLVPFINQAAVAYHAVGQLEQADPLYRETLAIGERALGLDHPLVAQSLHDLAGLLRERGRLAEAQDSLRRALTIRQRVFGDRHPEVALTRVELARCLALDPSAGDRAALPELEQAVTVLDAAPTYPEARLDAHALRASLRDRGGDRAAAIDDLAQALAAVDSLRAWRGGGDEARGGLVARHLELFHRMVTWRLEAGDVAGALETHERARARILLDQLSAGAVNLRAGIPTEVLAPLEGRERAARQGLAQAQRLAQEASYRPDLQGQARLETLAALDAARDSAAWELQRAQQSIRERSPLWRDVLNAGGHPASLAELQRELVGRDELMLEYHVGADASYLFVIPSGHERPWTVTLALDSVGARELRIQPGPFTAAKLEAVLAGDPERPAFGTGAPVAALLALAGEEERTLPTQREPGAPGLLERRLAALGRTLMPPAAWRRVRGASRVIVIPDGALHLLPFEALVMEPPARGKPARYWLDHGPAIRYGTSATSLLSLTRRPGGTGSQPTVPRLLSVTNPAFAPAESTVAVVAAATGGRWAPLPGTARETAAIRRAFAPESVMVCEGLEAGEARVREAIAGRRLLHFATHGFVTGRRSDVLAGLVLTPPAGPVSRSDDDGYLQLYEIYELKLACDLAVLSACETQRGMRVAGEGVFALSRGFLAAGAERVVASLWSVQDESTALLMGDFFARVARGSRGGRTPDYATALRDAQRALRRQKGRDDPFYWAAFTLSGIR
jgi:CHAT domain-containing protein/tetratricopeptide (TPR) repeat protein